MNEAAIEYAKLVHALYTKHVESVGKFRELIKKTTNVEEIADWAYMCNETRKYLDEMRKNLEGLEALAERIGCLLYTHLGMDGPIRTEYVTASPNVKMIATIPKRSTNPEAYLALMKHLGIPDELTGSDEYSEVVRCHWPGLVQYLSDCMAAGKPLPPGIEPDKTYPEYHMTLRRKKGVTER